MTTGQQDNIGILARAAVRHATGQNTGQHSALIASAVSDISPLLSDSDRRMLIHDVDNVLSNPEADRTAWAELLTTLRRVG